MPSSAPEHSERAQSIRALIVGDSVAVPRPNRGQRLEDTWPVLLKAWFPHIDFWQRCRAAATSWDVVKEYGQFSDSIDAFRSLIVQVGIADCCPRPYPFALEKLLRAYLSPRAMRKINEQYHWMLKLRARPFTSKEQFLENFRSIIQTTFERNPRSLVVIIAIGPPCHDLVRKASGIEKYQQAYNQTLKDFCAGFGRPQQLFFVDPYAGHEAGQVFLDDGHHLTVFGHNVVAEAVAQVLKTNEAQQG